MTSLYSNIDHNLAIEAISYWTDKFPNDIHIRFNKQFIIEGIELILRNNSFNFDNKGYLQVFGCAMGSKFSPNLAILVMAYLELDLYNKIELKYGTDIRQEIEKRYKRYLDDIFIILNINHISEVEFRAMLNSLHEKIQFTGESSRDSIPYLDIKVVIKGNKIETDLYRKQTDSMSYLTYESCHPRSCKNSIPFSLARRICCIVSEKKNQSKHIDELRQILIKKNYPISVINKGIEKAQKLSLTELRTPKVNNEENILPFITDFCPNAPEVFTFIKRNFSTMNRSPRMKEVLENVKLIRSNRQGPSLRKILTRARFGADPNHGAFKCNLDPRCMCCKDIKETNTVYFPEVNGTFHIRSTMTCISKNLIYKLTCLGCNASYIGETGDELKNRTSGHRSGIMNDDKLEVDIHIHRCTRDLLKKFEVIPFYKIKEDNISLRKAKESYFISLFKPELNKKP